MLEIRYDKTTGKLTGWWTRPGNQKILKAKKKNRPNEAITKLNISLPDKPLFAWIFDKVTKSLIPDPDYVEPELGRNLAAEIDDLKATVKALGG